MYTHVCDTFFVEIEYRQTDEGGSKGPSTGGGEIKNRFNTFLSLDSCGSSVVFWVGIMKSKKK